jgi:hypothetical protein
MLSFLELGYKPATSLALSLRYTLFGNDGSDAAHYAIEQDLPGRLLSRQLNGNGSRLYLYGRWEPGSRIALSAKFGETYYTDRQVIGAGTPQQISGPVDSNLSVQLDASF